MIRRLKRRGRRDSGAWDEPSHATVHVAPGLAGSRRFWSVLLALALVAVSGICRLYASLGDFWMDEIWSWMFVLDMDSAWDVFDIRHDNNHYLNTWMLYQLGVERHWIWYRIPAVIFGMGAVAIAGVIGRRSSAAEGFLAMVLMGGSYLCIHYSSEARGYAYVMFFSLLSFWIMQRLLEGTVWWFEILFGACCVCGFLSHLSFANCYAALMVWSVVHCWRTHRDWLVLSRWHIGPVLFVIGLYYVNLHGMTVGGGPETRLGEVIGRTLLLSVGGPESGPLSVSAGVLAVCGLFYGLVLMGKSGSDVWLFYVIVMVVAPLAILGIVPRSDYYVRYFLVVVTFALLVYARVLSHLFRQGGAARWAAVVVVLLVIMGNGLHIQRLIQLGRGSYQEAIRLMQRSSGTATFTVSSDHDARNVMVLTFYRPQLPNPQQMVYISSMNLPDDGVNWFLVHSQNRRDQPRTIHSDRHGNQYKLIRRYGYAGLSGWNWDVYRRKSPKTED